MTFFDTHKRRTATRGIGRIFFVGVVAVVVLLGSILLFGVRVFDRDPEAPDSQSNTQTNNVLFPASDSAPRETTPEPPSESRVVFEVVSPFDTQAPEAVVPPLPPQEDLFVDSDSDGVPDIYTEAGLQFHIPEIFEPTHTPDLNVFPQITQGIPGAPLFPRVRYFGELADGSPLIAGFGEGAPPTTLSAQQRLDEENRRNIDGFIPELRRLNAHLANQTITNADGEEVNLLDAIEEQVRRDVATTTPLSERFFPEALENSVSPPISLLHKVRVLISGLFGPPPTAHAIAGVPFGGSLLTRFPCPCSGTWMIQFGPPVPVVLDYAYTQAFGYYNLPFALNAVGEFFPGVPTCILYIGIACTPIATAGLISPIVGSQ